MAVSSWILGSPWQPGNRRSCLATGNFNEEITKLYLEKKKSWKDFGNWHKFILGHIYGTHWEIIHKTRI